MFKAYREKRREKRLRKMANRAIVMLWQLDINMKNAGWSRQQRRQFWRDFTKSPKARDVLFGKVLDANSEGQTWREK